MTEKRIAELRELATDYREFACDARGYDKNNALSEALNEIERLKRPLECGHPEACIVGSDEGTNYCGWCASIEEFKERVRARHARLHFDTEKD